MTFGVFLSTQLGRPPMSTEYADDFATLQVIYRVTRRPQGAAEAVIQHFIASDQTPVEVIASLAAYYQLSETLAAPRTLKMLMEAGKDTDYALVFFNPENVQVVLAMETWNALCDMSGNSMMAASEMLNENVCKLLAGMDEFRPLMRLDFEMGPVEEATSED